MPKMSPFLLLPNQLATAVTTPGQPDEEKAPARIWKVNVKNNFAANDHLSKHENLQKNIWTSKSSTYLDGNEVVNGMNINRFGETE